MIGQWFKDASIEVLVEWWNGTSQRFRLADAPLEQCGEKYGVKRWCFLPPCDDKPYEIESGSTAILKNK